MSKSELKSATPDLNDYTWEVHITLMYRKMVVSPAGGTYLVCREFAKTVVRELDNGKLPYRVVIKNPVRISYLLENI